MTRGTVKFYDPMKGYGFIASDRDYFFHLSQCPDNYKPRIGDEVEFTTLENKKGWAASGITIVKVAE